MASKKPLTPVRAQLTRQQMIAAIPKLERRLLELKTLDPSKVQHKSDPAFNAIQDKIEHTLVELFGTDTVEAQRYYVRLDRSPIIVGGTPLHEIREGYARGVQEAITTLQTIIDIFREEIDDTSVNAQTFSPTASPREKGRKVFVVHGHDEGAKQRVARFLETLGLQPIVLHEQPDEGNTLIEKFEKHASNVDFAIILLTPDDIGYPAGRQTEAKPRARQNVILELGFFVANLGRGNVVALHTGNVEIPSDYHGVLYQEMDMGGGWQLRVAREMKTAGIDIDFNKVI